MAKKISKPNQQEKRRIDANLKKQYPKMTGKKGGWAEDMVKKETTGRTRTVTKQLKQAGLTSAEIARLRKKQ